MKYEPWTNDYKAVLMTLINCGNDKVSGPNSTTYLKWTPIL